MKSHAIFRLNFGTRFFCIAISKNFLIEDVVSPCGSCRQVISEYEVKQNENIRILLHQSDDSVIIIKSISDLLPLMFISEKLKNY